MAYYNAYNCENLHEFQHALYRGIKETCEPQRNIIILCIGTDRATGDCLGPLVGQSLKDKKLESQGVYIFGTLDEPVHAKNLCQSIEVLKK